MDDDVYNMREKIHNCNLRTSFSEKNIANGVIIKNITGSKGEEVIIADTEINNTPILREFSPYELERDFTEFLLKTIGWTGIIRVKPETWKKFENHRIYAKWLSVQLQYTNMEDWYTVQRSQFEYGNGLLKKYYNGSPIKFVMKVFPQYDWKVYKFRRCPNIYWKEWQNRKSYADDLGKHLGYITWEDWYQITLQQIKDFYGGGLLTNYYNDSAMKFVMDMYPQHNWDISKFSNHKTEKIVLKFLKERYPSVIFQFKQEWCKAKSYLPFDFCLPELMIIIELDGRQHFCQVSNWQSPEFTQKRDVYKMQCANDNNYSVIRIVQEDILNNVYDWKTKLIETIEEIKNGDSISNISLSMEDEY